MCAVAPSRSRSPRTISVRPPVSSVICRSASAFTRSSRRCGMRRPPRSTPTGGKRCPRPAAPAIRKGGPWRLAADRCVRTGLHAGAVHAERVDQHFALANHAAHCRHRHVAVGVVAVGDHEDRFLVIAAVGGNRQGMRDGVVHRGAAGRGHAVHRAADRAYLSFVQPCTTRGRLANCMKNSSSSLSSRSNMQPVDRGLCADGHLLVGHAAAGVEQDAEADRALSRC